MIFLLKHFLFPNPGMRRHQLHFQALVQLLKIPIHNRDWARKNGKKSEDNNFIHIFHFALDHFDFVMNSVRWLNFFADVTDESAMFFRKQLQLIFFAPSLFLS